uniref:G_PROTEIN_RECEP_F1_2 domain-containing protein n=2 Tax=Panagrellus redivivus TaxID=6233 RepID=A0A7E4VZ50_PANRE
MSLPETDPPYMLDKDGQLTVPSITPTDYIEMVVLVFLLLFGLPLNGLVLKRLIGEWNNGKNSARQKSEGARSTFLWLKIQLTLVDLILILCYCPSKLIWLISYQWYYGECLCKIVQYSWLFSSHLMSFAIVSIAIDRVRTVYRLMHIEKNGKVPGNSTSQLVFVKRLIVASYIASAVLSLPQFYAWILIESPNFSQCTTIWHNERALNYVQNPSESSMDVYPLERVYSLFHLLTVFWIPFLMLFFAYLYIVTYLFWYSLRPYSVSTASPKLIKHSVEMDVDSENLNLWNNRNPSPLPPLPTVKGTIKTAAGTIPAWRIEMRSKMFNTSIQVIAAYLVCWMPYNVLALAIFLHTDVQILISTHAEVLRIFIIFNTVINPFIYGFRPN